MPIPIKYRAYRRHIKRLFFGPGTLESASFETQVIFPKSAARLTPAVFLPGQIDKVTENSAYGTTNEHELREATALEAEHGPTLAYHVRDAALIDGSIYAGRWKMPVAERSFFKSAAAPVQLSVAGLVSSFNGAKYFHHWLADDCTQYLLAEAFGPLCAKLPDYRDRPSYENYLNQYWIQIDRAIIDHLVVFDDFAQNISKGKRYRILRERLRAHFADGPPGFVYLKRGTLGANRRVANEPELIESLTSHGFIVADLDSESLDRILAKLVNAKIVVSLEGSQIAHCCYALPDKSGLIVLQPADRFVALHRTWADLMSVRFGFVVGDKHEHGYFFSPSEIMQTVDLMLNSIEQTKQGSFDVSLS